MDGRRIDGARDRRVRRNGSRALPDQRAPAGRELTRPGLGAEGRGGTSKTPVQRRRNGVAKNLLQRQRSDGASSFISGPPIPLTECWTRHQSNSSQRQSERSQQPGSSFWHAGAEPQVRDQPRTRSERRQRNGNPIDRRSGAQTPPARSMVPARTCRDEREPMELAFLARDRAPRRHSGPVPADRLRDRLARDAELDGDRGIVATTSSQRGRARSNPQVRRTRTRRPEPRHSGVRGGPGSSGAVRGRNQKRARKDLGAATTPPTQERPSLGLYPQWSQATRNLGSGSVSN